MPNIYPSEKGFKIQVTIKDEAGAVVNLTGATVVLQVVQPDKSTITKSASLDTPASGICSYTTIDESDFTQSGNYTIQPKITLSSGNIFYGDTQTMVVTPYGR